MSSIVADTHIVAWLLNEPSKLSSDADAALANAVAGVNDKIFVSAISLVELHYLIEKHRVSPSVLDALLSELKNSNSIFEIVPLDFSIAVNLTKISRSDVSDMPDRIIAVTALLLQLPLVTADKAIRASGLLVIW
ncbi:MAG: PIN domain-containing protein [Pyrinomonadaceae bacterium]